MEDVNLIFQEINISKTLPIIAPTWEQVSRPRVERVTRDKGDKVDKEEPLPCPSCPPCLDEAKVTCSLLLWGNEGIPKHFLQQNPASELGGRTDICSGADVIGG